MKRMIILSLLVPGLAIAGANEDFAAGVAAYKAKNYPEAEKQLRSAVSADETNPQFRLRLAKSIYKQKRYDEAILELKALLAKHPRMAAGRYQMALVQRKAGQLQEAVQSYSAYVRMMPEDPDGFYGVAETYVLLGEPQQAIANYEKYVSLEKRPSEQKYVKKAQVKIGQLKEALSASTRPASNKSVKSVAKKGLKGAGVAAPYLQKIARQAVGQGDALRSEKKLKAAAEAYRDAALRDPQNVEARFKLGEIYAEMGNFEGAKEAFEAAAALKPKSAPIQGNLARVSKALSKAPQAQGNSPSTLGTAVELLSRGKYSNALPMLDAYVAKSPKDVAAHIARGSALLALKKLPEAMEAYGNALALRPDLSLAHFGLGEVYRLLGDRARSVRHFQSYLSSTGKDRNPMYDQVANARVTSLGG
jgi:tetratricopeptide (TPR) repeat protein